MEMSTTTMLRQINHSLAASTPLANPSEVDFTQPKGVEQWTFNLHGESVTRIVIYLRSDVGCEFGRKTGGCLGCRHWRLGTAGRKLDIENLYVRQVESALSRMQSIPPVVNLYNEGNVLNDAEIPHDQLIKIIKYFSINNVRRLVIESRPEYIKDDTLQSLQDAAGSMEIEVGIGIESANEVVRNELFLKSMALSGYEEAIKRLKSFGMRSLAYVIVKPPFLTEVEAIADAIATAKYVFNAGTDVISLEPIGVEPNTVTEYMHQNGIFTPSTLWSVISVLDRVGHLGETRLGGIQFSPRPTTLAHNCTECTDEVIREFDAYNSTYNAEKLLSLSCDCMISVDDSQIATAIDDHEIRNRISRFIADHQMRLGSSLSY